MVGADRFASIFLLWFILRMPDFRSLLLNTWFQFLEKNLLADHPSLKQDFRAVRRKSKSQMDKEILSWFLFWVTAFTREARMPLYRSLNLQLSNWEEIWNSVQLSICNTWKLHLVLAKGSQNKGMRCVDQKFKTKCVCFWQINTYERISSNCLFSKQKCNKSPRSLQLGKGLKLALLKITVLVKEELRERNCFHKNRERILWKR